MEILKEILKSEADFRDFCDSFEKGRAPSLINGVCDSVRPLFCCAFSEKLSEKPLILVGDEKTAYSLRDKLSLYMEDILVYPSRDFLFDEITVYSKEFEQERISVLVKLTEGNYSAVIAVPDAVMQYTVPEKILADNIININKESAFDIDSLASNLSVMGYNFSDIVEGPGQYTVRGGILDVYSPSAEYPCRIDFFGSEIDLMGIFDTISQRRIENIDSYKLVPVNEFLYDQNVLDNIGEAITTLQKSGRAAGKAKNELQKEYEDIKEGALPKAVDKYFSVIYEKKETIFDYMKNPAVIVFDLKRVLERAGAFAWQYDQTLESASESGRGSYKLAGAMIDRAGLLGRLSEKTVVLDYFPDSKNALPYKSQFNILTKSGSGSYVNTEILKEDISAYLGAGYRILYLAGNERAAENIIDMLEQDGITAVRFNGEVYKSVVSVEVSAGVGAEGFELPRAGFVLITDNENNKAVDIHKKYIRKYKFKKSEKIASYADLNTGDFVVHANHGIGVYAGFQTLVREGATKDYIKIQYAGSDVLYVPCNQLDLVSKYIGAGADAKVKLSKMGSSEWQRAKAKTRKAAKNIAKELIALYAERRKREGYAFSADGEYQSEFESTFDYTETEGQLIATEEIKSDMEKIIPMDRLLCGDVGFGKTEVALRAAFKCINDGKQVAILVPTTILALQHYNTMQSRFRNFPITAAMLSRFVGAKDQRQITGDIKNGKIDIIVGTHKLLQKNIEFKNLGLLIVDEEQRFGVTHKEKLKQLATNVDVLTLTATPIPRTLNMALSGIRDMSVLEEAPQDRIPVQSYVLEHDDEIIDEAVRRELRRGGQVFYLHNFIDSIYSKASKLARTFENSIVGVAHGQMQKDELSDIWQSMVNGEIDILVCTTIIETGIDIPNANTLIIEEANRMGLSQLHQIRGRVGRSPRKAYAYFTYRQGSLLSEIATKRLNAIKEFTEFGSGFKIAMRDLELRGAGNILGAEQSGHMEAVGYDLYIKILEEAVNEEKGIIKPSKKDCLVEINTDAFIPDEYIESSQIRIDMYRKIALLDSREDEDDLVDEMLDRFGDIPKPVYNLLDISLSRNQASEHGIRHISQKGSVIAFYCDTMDIETTSKLATVRELRGRIMISGGAKPHFAYKLDKNEETVHEIKKVLNIYTNLTQNSTGQI